MKYLMIWGLLAGALSLALLARNNVENMRFAKYEPGWTVRKTWWLDRLMLVAAVTGVLGLAAVLTQLPLTEKSGYENYAKGPAGLEKVEP